MLVGAGTGIQWLATGGAVVFVVLFATLAPWRRTQMGRHMMSFMVVLMIILLYIVFAPALGPLSSTTRGWVRVASFGSLGVVLWWRVYLLIGAQADNLKRIAAALRNPPPRERRQPLMESANKYAKAIVAALLAILAALLPAVSDGHISATEIVLMVTAGVVTLGTVWGVPNAPSDEAGGKALTSAPTSAQAAALAGMIPTQRAADQTAVYQSSGGAFTPGSAPVSVAPWRDPEVPPNA